VRTLVVDGGTEAAPLFRYVFRDVPIDPMSA